MQAARHGSKQWKVCISQNPLICEKCTSLGGHGLYAYDFLIRIFDEVF